MVIAWTLRDKRMTTALIGTCNVQQMEECVASLKNTTFSVEELAEIDEYGIDSGVNLWSASSSD